MREKLVLAVNLALVLLLSAAFFIAPAGWSDEARAAQPSEQDKLSIDNVEYDWVHQQFVIYLSGQLGMAQENKKAEVMVGIKVVVGTGIDGVGDILLTHEYNITKLAGATKDDDGKVQLEPQIIGWDRHLGDNNYFKGKDVPVTTYVVLKNPQGKNLGNVVSKWQEMEIWPP